MSDDSSVYLARGITQSECLEGTMVAACAYKFDKNQEEGLAELSVQWLDSMDSVVLIKSRIKEERGQPQFSLGFAVLSLRDIDVVSKMGIVSRLECSRKPNDVPGFENPYHGHLSFPLDEWSQRKKLMVELASRSVFYGYDQELPISSG